MTVYKNAANLIRFLQAENVKLKGLLRSTLYSGLPRALEVEIENTLNEKVAESESVASE